MLFLVFSFILDGIDVDHQKFKQANKQMRLQQQLQKEHQPSIPDWLTSKTSPNHHHFNKAALKNNSRDLIDIKLNGEDQTTIVQGEPIVVTIFFSDNCFEADVTWWADMNDNAVWEDQIDLIIPDSGGSIVDNDIEDEDPTVGVYQITVEVNDGPNMVANIGMFFVAEDTGGIDDAFVFIDPLVSDYSISGDVTPAIANLIVMAMNEDEEMFMTATSSTGSYQNYVADAGIYYIMAFDPLNVLNGMFSLTNYDPIDVNGHLTGYDFTFEPGNSTIEGTVTNESNNSVEGITVYARQEGPTSVWGLTDENGFYQIGVIEGTWYIDFNPEELIPDYMRPQEVEVEILEGNTETVDITLYETDSFIEGTVYLDGVPTQGFEINAWNDMVGDSRVNSSLNGTYDLPVASEANPVGGYNVNIDIWNIPGLYVEENYSNIMTGTSGIDFHIITASGGIEGYLYDSVTLEPIDEGWISAYDGTNYYNTGTDNDGYYTLYLPNGTYDVWAQGEMYYQQYIDDVLIDDDYVNIDFYLDPISYEGSLSGMVFEQGTTNPIPFAELSVWDDDFWSDTTADENGFYYFDMPNGTFTLSAWHPLFYGSQVENIEILSNAVTVDIEMQPINFSGALEGYVYENDTTIPIPFANIEIQGEGLWFPTMSDDQGFYHVGLPNGFFTLNCWKEGYVNANYDNIEINDNIVELIIDLIPDVEVDQILEPDINNLSNYPNPFNPSTTIEFSIQNDSEVELYVFNIKGHKIKQLISEQQSAGKHSVMWNGDDESGKSVSSGVYFYMLKVNGKNRSVKKCLILK